MTTHVSGTTGVDQITDGTIQTADFATGVGPVLTKYYESPEQALVTSGSVTLSHGHGVAPKFCTFFLICKIAEAGYSVGDIVQLGSTDYFTASTGTLGHCATLSASSVYIRYASNAQIYQVLNKSTSVVAGTTSANWNLIVRAWA